MGAVVALVAVVVGQRLVVPAGAVSLPVPLLAGLALLAALFARGSLHYSRVRLEMFLAASMCVLACSCASGLTGLAIDSSLGSVLLLLVSYVPWVFRSSIDTRLLRKSFVVTMCACSVVSLGQIGAQWVTHAPYADPLDLLPSSLVNQSYNTDNPIRYGTELLKPNAVVFLEPSFLSQFLALAIVVALVTRAPVWQPFLLGLGLASALSGTGPVLLAVGGLLLASRGGLRRSHVVAGILGLALVLSTPAAGLLLDRRFETTQPGTSGYARFVEPYTETARGLAASPGRYLVGAGPGSADRLLESQRSRGTPVVYPVLPKLAFEYGIVSAVLFAAFLLTALLQRSPVLGTSLSVMLFLLSGSLLQPHTTMLAWLLGVLPREQPQEEEPGEPGGEDLGEREPVGSAGRARGQGPEHTGDEHERRLDEAHPQHEVAAPGGLESQ